MNELLITLALILLIPMSMNFDIRSKNKRLAEALRLKNKESEELSIKYRALEESMVNVALKLKDMIL